MGELLRRGIEPHRCSEPAEATKGDVWRCGCGRRYTCVHGYETGMEVIGANAFLGTPSWRRRIWPWPRSDG